MKPRIPIWPYLVSLPIFFFGHGLFSSAADFLVAGAPRSFWDDFFFFYIHSDSWWSALFILTITTLLPTAIAYFQLARQLIGTKPQSVYYIELPVLLILYIIFRSLVWRLGVMYSLTTSEWHYADLCLTGVPAFFVLLWLLSLIWVLRRTIAKRRGRATGVDPN